MRTWLLCCLLLGPLGQVCAQRLAVRDATISFFSKAAIEDISATSQQVQGLLDVQTGAFAFRIAIRSFEFPNKLMQEHFNENYLESETHPFATFEGKLNGWQVDLSGPQKLHAEGALIIHGVERQVSLPIALEKNNTGHWVATTSFAVKLQDHNIRIPKLLWQNIADVVQVSATLSLSTKKP